MNVSIHKISLEENYYNEINNEISRDLRLLKFGYRKSTKICKCGNIFHTIKSTSIYNCNKCNTRRVNKFVKEKRKKNKLYRFKTNTRTLIWNYLKNSGLKNSKRTEEILGCSYDLFKEHIEKQFIKGMTWDNYGKWHLDHILPMNSGKTEQESLDLNRYENFQPLWASDNHRKKDKIPIISKLY